MSVCIICIEMLYAEYIHIHVHMLYGEIGCENGNIWIILFNPGQQQQKNEVPIDVSYNFYIF